MFDLKEIIFDTSPGYFSGLDTPSTVIKINETRMSCQQYTYDTYGKKIKGPLWKAPTDKELFRDLKYYVDDLFKVEPIKALDASGTLITARLNDGTRLELYLPLSFRSYGLDRLVDILKEMLSALTMPGFLGRNEE